MSIRWLHAVVLGMSFMLLAPPPRAVAQAAAPGTTLADATAQRALAASRNAERRGEIEVARTELLHAYAAEPNPALLYLLATFVDKHPSGSDSRLYAADLLRRYLDETKNGESLLGVPPIAELEQRIAAVRSQAAEVVVYGEEDDLLCIDGRLAGRLHAGWTHWVSPGRHRFTVGCEHPKVQEFVQAELELPVILELYADRPPVVQSTVPVVATYSGGVEPPAAMTAFNDAVRQELLRSRHHLLSSAKLAEKTATLPKNCATQQSCMLSLAQNLKARFWFRFFQPEVSGSGWQVQTINVESGQECGGVPLCRDCNDSAERAEALVRLRDLVTRAQRCETGKLQVDSRPNGARILLDDSLVGLTPAMVTVLSGDHRLTIHKSGYLPQRQPLSVAPHEVVELPPFALVVNDAARRSRRWRAGAIGLGIGGGLALIGGAVAFAIDCKIVDPIPLDGGGMTQQCLRTWPAGIAALSGAALAFVGTGIFVWQARKQGRIAVERER